MTYERAEPGQVPSAFVPPKASHPVPRTPPSWGPGSAALLSLQRSAGNRAATLAVQAGGGRHLASASPGTDVDSEHVRGGSCSLHQLSSVCRRYSVPRRRQ